MKRFEEFLAIGSKLGLDGKELLAFAENREAKALEQDKIDREERQKEREHDREMKECELKLAEQSSAANSTMNTSVKPSINSLKKPRLPVFQDRKDDLDAYIKRFERFATTAGWPEDEWATTLSTLLSGRALELYSRLPSEKADDYDELKLALLHRYDFTEEGFRTKFRTSQVDEGEKYSQFAQRIAGYLNRWIEIAEVEKEYDSLVDLIVREQMLSSCPKDLVVFLRERKPKSVKEMTTYADQYSLAHATGKRTEKQRPALNRSQVCVEPKPSYSNHSYKPNSITDRSITEKECYVCGGRGHIARFCRRKYRSPANSNRDKVAGLDIVGERTNTKPCSSQPLGACIQIGQKPCPHVTSSPAKNVKLACGGELPIVSAACTIGSNMPVVQGLVGDQSIEVLRDTGCSTASS